MLVRAGKGGKRGMVGMDDWAWEHVGRWTEHRVRLPIGPLFCILAGPPAAVDGPRPPREVSLEGSLARPECGAGSRRTS